MEKTWTLYYWMGNGKSRVMGQLTCTREAVNKAIAELSEEHRTNLYTLPSNVRATKARRKLATFLWSSYRRLSNAIGLDRVTTESHGSCQGWSMVVAWVR